MIYGIWRKDLGRFSRPRIQGNQVEVAGPCRTNRGNRDICVPSCCASQLQGSEDRGHGLRRVRKWGGSRRPPSKSKIEDSSVPSDDDIVVLNVGGRNMMTARSTLLQVTGSMLHEMFCRENQHLLHRNSKGEVFLDFEPHIFGLVLRFLREIKMHGGHPDMSLSSFRQEDRAHMLLLLSHLRLLPASQSQERQQQKLGQQEQQEQQRQQQQQQQQHWSQALNLAGMDQQQRTGDQAIPQDAHQPQQGKDQVLVMTGGQLVSSHGGDNHCKTSQKSGNTSSSGITSSSGSGGSGSVSGSGSGGIAGQHANEPGRLIASPVAQPVSSSQLYYIQAQYEQKRGIRVSVYTESDLSNLAPSESFDVFCDTTASERQLAFTYVCRQDFENVFLGITTRDHTDCKGSLVPCFGWRSQGCIQTGEDHGVEDMTPSCHAGSTAGLGQGHAPAAPLWRKGDSVELIVTLGNAFSRPRMVLKVNGREQDSLEHLPPLHNWAWYVALYMGGDMSAVTFMSDSYAVSWGDYQVKRFLS